MRMLNQVIMIECGSLREPSSRISQHVIWQGTDMRSSFNPRAVERNRRALDKANLQAASKGAKQEDQSISETWSHVGNA
jgi:hypothetical protein